MTRGAKIVVFSIVGLFVFAVMYFTFIAPPKQTEPLADTTPTVSESTTLTLAPTLAPGSNDAVPAPFGTVTDPAVPSAYDPAFARTSTTTDNFPAGNLGDPMNSSVFNTTIVAPAPVKVTMDPVLPAILPTNTPPSHTTTVVAKPAPKTNYTSYTVGSGDTLSSIAGIWFRDTSKWQLIADINPGLKPSTLKVGQKINLPAKSGKSVTKVASTTKSSAVLTAANEHVVASGETLASISDKAYGNRSNWKRIYEANKGVIGSDPSRLKVGTKLTIPSKS